MSRRQTLGALSPSQISNRPGAGGGGAGGAPTGAARQTVKDGRPSTMGGGLKPLTGGAGRPSIVPSTQNNNNAALIDSRRSSAFGKSASGVKQDPRPLGSKDFLNACIRTVITYLSTHGYPYAVSPKLLASPTGKDFAQIVAFLFQKFDPTIKAPLGKVEDEVPVFFKRLNYPFQISKSALFAVGSPHSWPSVLAALTWLVELLNYEDKADDASGGIGGGANGGGVGVAAPFDDKQSGEREFFAYVGASYRHFLAGEDHCVAAADEEMLGQFRAREAALAGDLERLQQVWLVGWLVGGVVGWLLLLLMLLGVQCVLCVSGEKWQAVGWARRGVWIA